MLCFPLCAVPRRLGTAAIKREPIAQIRVERIILDSFSYYEVKEVKARDAFVLAIAWAGDTEIGKSVDQVISIPRVNPFLAPVAAVIPLQLLAYYASVARGNDVDNPRNLAKSVTVE